MTPGQAAYEAYWTRESSFVVTPWGERMPPSEREAWEAAAQAVLNDAFPGLRKQLTDITREHALLVRYLGPSATQALLGNPLVDAVVEAGLGMVLTPGEVAAVVAFVKAIEAERAQQAAPAQQANGAPAPAPANAPAQQQAAAPRVI